MQDVARAAGVSHQTVSRVLNGHPRVRPETRDRVLAAVADLGYRRNLAARALVTSRSGTIGLLSPRSTLHGPVSTLISIEEAVRTAGMFVSVASLRDYDVSSVAAALDHFLDQGVEGIIVIAPVPAAVRAASALASQVPMIVIASDTAAGPGYQTISVDQEMGARLATRHLVELGHTHIAHISGPADWLDASARRRGWHRELSDSGLVAGRSLVGDWTAESGLAVGRQLLAEGLPSAVFAANDLMALGLVRALTEAGRHVPAEVSVVGFDDIEGASCYLPPLTTVRQDFTVLGERSCELLLAQLSNEETASAAIMAPELIVRSSTCPPRLVREA
ncbi:MAG: LacI family DNA-binding transcriptional regulator [Propionibacteriaceae bacterium]|nr:LacI family DNA-binding transcriptional regulator [Propionibacteriaceae bacterium]